MGGGCGTHGGQERCVQGFWCRYLNEKTLGRPRCRWKIILKWIFKSWFELAWTGLLWLRRGTGGGLL